MATEAWTVDGRNLTDIAYDIVTFDGLDDVPDLVGDNAQYQNRHGGTWNKKYFGQGHKAVSMLVRNCDPSTGVVPAGFDAQRQNLDTNLDKIIRIFYRPRHLLDVRRTLSDGSIRQAMCEVVAGVRPTLLGLNSARVGFDLNLPFSFWQDVNIITSATYAPSASVSITEFAAASAPMQDLKYKITGPITSPKVTDLESGSWFRFNGVIAAAQTLEVDAATMTITPAGGLTANLSQMEHVGDPRWLTLHASLDGALLKFEGSSTTGATALQVIGTRKYLR